MTELKSRVMMQRTFVGRGVCGLARRKQGSLSRKGSWNSVANDTGSGPILSALSLTAGIMTPEQELAARSFLSKKSFYSSVVAIPVSKLANALLGFQVEFHPNESHKKHALTLTNGTASATILYDLTFNGKASFRCVGRTYAIDSIDICVQDAVFNLAHSALSSPDKKPLYFTPAMIYRFICGGSDKATISSEVQATIERSIDKLANTLLYASFRAQVNKLRDPARCWVHTIKPGEEFAEGNGQVIAPLLNVRKYRMDFNKSSTVVYEMVDYPAIYRYSSESGAQVLFADSDVLSICEVGEQMAIGPPVRSTLKRVMAKMAILKRVGMGVFAPDHVKEAHRVCVDTLMQDIFGTASQVYQERYRMLQYIRQVFDYWVAVGFLEGYEEVMSSGTLVAFDFVVKRQISLADDLPLIL